MPMLRPQPSYANGFARSQGESAHPELWDGMRGAWIPALGVQGGSLFDVSGRGNHGTLTNMDPSTDWVVGKNGHAIDFTTANTEHVKVSDGKITDSTFGFIEALVKVTTLVNVDKIVSYGGADVATAGIFALEIRQNTNFFFSVIQRSDDGSVGIVHGDTQIVVGRWYHVILSSDGSAWKIYVDGSEETLNVLTGSNSGNWIGDTTVTSPDESQIGGILFDGSQVNQFTGQIELAYIYDGHISPAEAKMRSLNPLAPFELKRRPVTFVPAAPVGFIPYPNPRYALAGGMQPLGGGIS